MEALLVKLIEKHIDPDGRRHRLDGPAIVWSDGTEEWYLNGVVHREEGPAVTKSNGDQLWYQNGKKHRLNGPAWIYDNGKIRLWCVGGILLPGIEKSLVSKDKLFRYLKRFDFSRSMVRAILKIGQHYGFVTEQQAKAIELTESFRN